MKGLILKNLYDSLPAYLNQSVRLKEQFKKLGVKSDIMPNSPTRISLDSDGNIINAYAGYDFCVYLDKDKYCSYLLEKSGMRLFNRHDAVRACDDKMTTHSRLALSGIKMPATVPGALCYSEAPLDLSVIEGVENKMSYPVVVKTCYGSLGNGVHLAKNRKELIDLAKKYRRTPHLFQKFIAESAGRDIRVITVGGQTVAAMERKSAGDFRSNLELGGTGSAIKPDTGLQKLCKKVSDILNLDYCGIDVLESDRGYTVCEVNSNAFFGGIERITGVNVAERYAEYIISVVKTL